MDMEKWLERATSKIDFSPDRAAVRQELADHLRDKREHYAARGLSPEEAEETAVADMGDPAQVAEELGRLHAPWWGYLWRASRWLVGLSVLALIAALFFSVPEYDWKSSRLADSYQDLTVLSEQKLPERVKAGNYTVSAASALLEGENRQFLLLSLRFAPHIPWEPVADSLYRAAFRNILTDSGGRQRSMGDGGIKDFAFAKAGPIRYLEFSLPLDGEAPPAWVDVPLGSYTVRVDLEEGVSLR